MKQWVPESYKLYELVRPVVAYAVFYWLLFIYVCWTIWFITFNQQDFDKDTCQLWEMSWNWHFGDDSAPLGHSTYLF